MSLGVSERARRAWDEWNIRVAVLGSLFFQIVLTVVSNSRRRSRSRVMTAIIWSCYLLADWIAAFAVGLISSGQPDEKEAVNKHLAVFWGPFLLLHLGGPDAITAFSLEDNELWIRHLMGLLIQGSAVMYVFFQSQSLSNDYGIPTVLVYLAGVCRYAERTIALYQACLGNFKRSLLLEPNAGPDYAKLMQELSNNNVPFRIVVVDDATQSDSAPPPPPAASASPYIDIVLRGYRFFETFMGLIVDQIFTIDDRNDSRFFFLRTTAVDAFKVMEVELSFIYDVFYTKMALVHCKFGYLCRLICTALILAGILLFASLPRHNIDHFDKIVTYILLVGAVALETLGLLMLLFSDWVVVSVKKGVSRFLVEVPFVGKRKARWSDTVAKHSFISFCLKRERIEWANWVVAIFFRINDTIDEFLHVKKEACGEDLKKLIFDQLKAKAAEAHTPEIAKSRFSARGDFLRSEWLDNLSYPSISRSFSDEVEYDEALLLWHIATEICYFTSVSRESKEYSICKLLSDYMLYLLIMRPTLMSPVVGIAQIRFQDTCEETIRFFKKLRSGTTREFQQGHASDACSELLATKAHAKLDEVKGNSSKSLLFRACMLATDLKGQWVDEDMRWKMMSKVWVDLLSYGASRCNASDHARGLSQGGELITFVWLLMVHFGLGDNFKIGPRAKLIVDK